MPSSDVKKLSAPSILLMLLLLAGCAAPTLTPQDCQLGAWYAVGSDDGRNGRDDSILSRHRKACDKYDIDIDGAEYARGYRDGNKVYCDTYDHYRAGIVGEPHKQVCPGEPYASDHARGIEIFCQNIDHYAVGQAGEPFNDICPAYPYEQEHRQGIAYYCENTNPWYLARNRGNYRYVCDSRFDRAYDLGRESLRQERLIAELEEDLGNQIRSLIDEEDTDKAEEIRLLIKQTEQNILSERRELLRLKLEVKDLGYLSSSDLLDDLILLAL